MPFEEVVEAEGHLIDSHVMEQIFDKVVESNGRFEVEQFRIGRTNSEPSYLRLRVETPTRPEMEHLLAQMLAIGCSPVESGDAVLGLVERDAARRKTSIPPATTTPSCASAASGWKCRTSAWTR